MIPLRNIVEPLNNNYFLSVKDGTVSKVKTYFKFFKGFLTVLILYTIILLFNEKAESEFLYDPLKENM